jgi:hypothetical protein
MNRFLGAFAEFSTTLYLPATTEVNMARLPTSLVIRDTFVRPFIGSPRPAPPRSDESTVNQPSALRGLGMAALGEAALRFPAPPSQSLARHSGPGGFTIGDPAIKWLALSVRPHRRVSEICNRLEQAGLWPYWPHYSRLETDCSQCRNELCPRLELIKDLLVGELPRQDQRSGKHEMCSSKCPGITRGANGQHVRKRVYYPLISGLIFIWQPQFDWVNEAISDFGFSAGWLRDAKHSLVTLSSKDIMLMDSIREGVNNRLTRPDAVKKEILKSFAALGVALGNSGAA